MSEQASGGIARPSVASLLLAPHNGKQALSTATGFVVESEDGRRWLITNWHVVSGRDPRTGRPLSASGEVPDRLRVLHNLESSLGRWTWRIEYPVGKDDEPRWLEHPEHGRAFDVVALELTDTATVEFFPYDLDTIGLPGGQSSPAASPAAQYRRLPFRPRRRWRLRDLVPGHGRNGGRDRLRGQAVLLIEAASGPGGPVFR